MPEENRLKNLINFIGLTDNSVFEIYITDVTKKELRRKRKNEYED